MLLAFLAVLGFIGADPGERPLDRVVLNDGTKLEGRVVQEDGTQLVLRIGSKERVIERADVASATTRLSAWREALDRWEKLDKEDATKIADIGLFAGRLGLPEEARVFALRALAVDPDNRAARELLGHERKDKGWYMREDNRRYFWPERVKKSTDFGNGWKLETTHWSLRTNMPLLDATNAILDLENLYAIFFRELAPVVDARHLDTPLLAQIHADAGSYPEIAGGRGFYDRDGRMLVINAEGGMDRGLMIHEAIHQLLAETAVHSRGGRGEISPWLDEGLADYFRATTAGAPGRLAFDAGRVDTISMRKQVHSNDTYKLSRVLTFDSGEYLSTSRQDLKYAQSYSFVHFLIDGDGGSYRRGFDQFLRSAWKGQGSSTDLESALGAKVDVLEKAWKSWVKDRAR